MDTVRGTEGKADHFKGCVLPAFFFMNLDFLKKKNKSPRALFPSSLEIPQ